MSHSAPDIFSHKLIKYVQIGDRIPHPEKSGLSYSRFHATCTRCDRPPFTVSYANLKAGRVGCICSNPWKIAENARMERLIKAGLR